jgi:hypothetical protein
MNLIIRAAFFAAFLTSSTRMNAKTPEISSAATAQVIDEQK